jgi:hypothetical protein
MRHLLFRRPGLLLLTAVLAAGAAQVAAVLPPAPAVASGRYAEVTVEPAATSIYLGSVSLAAVPFKRSGGAYASDYTVKVFPFFFFNERGSISIDVSDEQLQQLDRGETVDFTGHASNSKGKERPIGGRAVPDGAGSDHGKIKVRVKVGRKIELVFNTVYRFTGKE